MKKRLHLPVFEQQTGSAYYTGRLIGRLISFSGFVIPKKEGNECTLLIVRNKYNDKGKSEILSYIYLVGV